MCPWLVLLWLTVGCAVLLAAPIPVGESFTNSLGMRFPRIGPGGFVMGYSGAAISLVAYDLSGAFAPGEPLP